MGQNTWAAQYMALKCANAKERKTQEEKKMRKKEEATANIHMHTHTEQKEGRKKAQQRKMKRNRLFVRTNACNDKGISFEIRVSLLENMVDSLRENEHVDMVTDITYNMP